MKTSTIKKVFQVVIVCTVILTSTIITKNMINNIKHLYGLESAGNGITCFFDILQ